MLLKSKAVLPEGYKVLGEIGDYSLCEYDDMFYIIGEDILEIDFVLSDWARVLPFTGDSLLSIIEGGDIPDVFNLKEDGMYYMTRIENKSYIFSDLEDALSLIQFFIELSVVIVNSRRG